MYLIGTLLLWSFIFALSFVVYAFGASRSAPGDTDIEFGISLAVIFFGYCLYFFLDQLPAIRKKAERYKQLVPRLVPRWAHVDSSVLGQGYRVKLHLTLSPEHTSSHLAPTAPQRLQWEECFEPHLCTVLGPGVWLEIAYDPVEHVILPQQLVTRDGAVLVMNSQDLPRPATPLPREASWSATTNRSAFRMGQG